MAVFQYLAAAPDGSREEGILTAMRREEAEKTLRARRLTVLRITETAAAADESPDFGLRERPAWEKSLAGVLIRPGAVEVALAQLAAMLDGGVPVLQALQTAAAGAGYFLRRALFCAANKLQGGSTLEAVLRQELPFLGEVTLGMVAAGEANGDIGQMCAYAAELLGRRRKLKGEIVQALTYPALVVCVTGGTVFFMMRYVIPKIMKFLTARHTALPPLTQALVDVTGFCRQHGACLLLLPLVFAAVWLFLRRDPRSARALDWMLLRLPVFGKVFRASENMLWCRTLGTLLRSGINIVPALEYTRNAIGNFYYRGELERIKNWVTQGHPLSTALRVSGLRRLVPLADSMLTVGESTGRVDDSLLKVSEFSGAELQKRIGLLSKLIEPALFLIIGGIVGFVYIAFFMGLMAASTGGR